MIEELLRSGDRVWRNGRGELHRDGDLPAIIWADGNQEWWVNGKLHRAGDQPAIVWSKGDQEWYQNGKLHRADDKPARVWKSGDQSWWINGKRHRDNDQPAKIWTVFDSTTKPIGSNFDWISTVNISSEWWLNGYPRRLLGCHQKHPYKWSFDKDNILYPKTYKNGNRIRLIRKSLKK